MMRTLQPPEGWTRDAEAWAEMDRLKERSGELAPDESPLVCRCASQIELEPVEWLWPGRLALGKHTAIGGDPGGGKSNLGMYIAATVSMGGAWPCGEGRSPQGSVLILNAEDGAGDTIVPRLHAAEADCGRVHIVSAVRTDHKSSRGFNLQADIELLEQKIRELGDVAMVIIDPVSSYLGKTDSHKNAEVRGVLEPLSAMAERTRVGVLSITHFSKAGASTGAKALHRFIGSIAFVGAPRMAFAVIEDADDRRLLLHAKNNLAAPSQGLAFRLKQTIVGEPGKGITASLVDWEPEPVTITANEALAAEMDTKAGTMKEDYAEFLRAVLADGPMKVKPDIEQEARNAGLLGDRESISQSKPCRKAREMIGIITRQDGFRGPWVWSLPSPQMPSTPTDAPLNNRAPVDQEGICGDGEGPQEGTLPLADRPDGDPFASLKDPAHGLVDDLTLPGFLKRGAA